MNPKLSPEQVTLFQDQGFFIVEDFFTQDEVVAVRDEITAIINRYPDVPDELVQIEPTVLKGEFEPESVEFGVRKLFRMTRHNDFFKKMAFHPKMVSMAAELFGPDISLFQSMLLMKPPHFGGEKVWHQDNAYFRLEPNNIFGFWIACDDATISNGCMHVIPGSHRSGIGNHGGVKDDYGLIAGPPSKEIVSCEMKSGSALIFHGELCHFTPANNTNHRRRALQYHYASTHCHSSADSPFPPFTEEVIVSGTGVGI
jgi:phytanoyl-CoA hydroxylase